METSQFNDALENGVPLGLASAEDTLETMKAEHNPVRLTAMRNDARRDLKWAERQANDATNVHLRRVWLERIRRARQRLELA